MEIAFKDRAAETACAGKKARLVSLIHENLGLASVADVQTAASGHLEVNTHAGSIFVTADLSEVLNE